jgi:hypothetical protein
VSVQSVTRKKAVELINGLDSGRIFSVLVKQRTGEKQVKRMACRKKVKKGVTGKGAKYDPTKKGLITVYKMAGAKSGFRSVATEGLMQIIVDGDVYNVRPNT